MANRQQPVIIQANVSIIVFLLQAFGYSEKLINAAISSICKKILVSNTATKILTLICYFFMVTELGCLRLIEVEKSKLEIQATNQGVGS